MLAKQLVSDTIPAVTESDSIRRIAERMTALKIKHLPVLHLDEYSGLISEKDIFQVDQPDQELGVCSVNLLSISVLENQHVYEVIDLIARYGLTILPVVNASMQYTGSITLMSLVANLNLLTGAGQPGAILVLSLSVRDYSPTLLARIIEDNQAKMISLYVVPDSNGQDLTVTIKVNTQETSSMVRSFERYGYTVQSSFLTNSQMDDFYRARYEEFMKYMNI